MYEVDQNRFVPVLVFTFLYGSKQSTFQYHEHESIGFKALGSHQLYCSMFNLVWQI